MTCAALLADVRLDAVLGLLLAVPALVAAGRVALGRLRSAIADRMERRGASAQRVAIWRGEGARLETFANLFPTPVVLVIALALSVQVGLAVLRLTC